MILQGEIWWADLGAPTGSEAGYRRPVLVVQGNALNRSRIGTIVCVPLTSNLAWAEAPGNVMFARSATGLTRDSVAQASLIVAVDRSHLRERVGKLSNTTLDLVLRGIDVVLGQ